MRFYTRKVGRSRRLEVTVGLYQLQVGLTFTRRGDMVLHIGSGPPFLTSDV